MTEEKREIGTWEEVIVDFFEYQIEKSSLFKARKYIEEKSKNIETEKDLKKLENLKKSKEIKQVELDTFRKNAPSTEVRQWLDETSEKTIVEGKRIIKATHVLRFSHGQSEAEGFLLSRKSDDVILTTESLKKQLTYDMAHNNGNLISISRFLALSLSDKLIIELILNNNFTFLEPFSENKIQEDKWKNSLKNLVEQRVIKTADKAKQIYFPLNDLYILDKQKQLNRINYHLIIPLFSSSLAQEIYYVVAEQKYGEVQKEIRIKKVSGQSNQSTKYHPNQYVDLPDLGIQKFGGKQPQNISMLNKNRSGQCFLFSSQPPTWKSQLKPPLYKKSLFDIFPHQNINLDIDYLRDYLLRFERIELSIKNPQRRKWIEKWVANMIDELLNYAATIQTLPAGWSNAENSKLKPEHQYFLDPYRSDEVFQNARKASHWQSVVCNDFSRWLNRKLVGKDKKFTPQPEHSRLWATLLEQPLREYNQMIEADSAIQDKVQVQA